MDIEIGEVVMARNEQFARARAAWRLTTGQLAERVADRICADTGRRPAIDADHVSRIERGLITWPGRRYRDALRVVLGTRTDAELGFHYQHRRTAAEVPLTVDVAGRLLPFTGAALVGSLDRGVVAGLTAELGHPPVPARIGHIDVDDLHHVIDGMERADHAAGGRTVVRSLALQQLA